MTPRWCARMLDQGINVDDIPVPQWLAERGW